MEYYLDDIDTIECIGDFNDEYVYDIEVDDETHTFIGNDILVHNSLYISMTPMMQSVDYDGDELKWILHFNGAFVKHLFTNFLEEYAKPYGVKNIHDFELETINKSGLHIMKKNYINNCVWEDGVFHEDLSHYSAKGVEIVKSSTPLFVRENIWDFINYLFKNPHNLKMQDLLKIVKNKKKEFIMTDIEDISMTTSCSNYENKVIDDQTGVECVKGAHHSIKSAALHNYLLNKNDQYKTKYDLLRGGKIKYYFCKHDLGERFSYMRSFHPIEIVEKEGVEIDYDTQFEKTFLKIANRFIEPIGLPVINKRLSVLNSIFSSEINGKKCNKNVVVEEEDDDDDNIEIISSDDKIIFEENDTYDDFEDYNEIKAIDNSLSDADSFYSDNNIESDDDFWN
jgi:hypothetical protein